MWRLPALASKKPLSCSLLINEPGQPLNKNCQIPFSLIGQCRDLAGRLKRLACGSSFSFQPVAIGQLYIEGDSILPADPYVPFRCVFTDS